MNPKTTFDGLPVPVAAKTRSSFLAIFQSFGHRRSPMKKALTLSLALIFLFSKSPFSQTTFTADDVVAPYAGPFRAGVNPGVSKPFSDADLADFSAGNVEKGIAGVGCRAWRPGLFESFLEEYGYEIRLPEYDHAFEIGLKENTAIVGFPSEAHRDKTIFCTQKGLESTLFANLYEPIWDGGANGTAVNEQNFFAAYLFKTVSAYKKHVRFWEIWNEPGFDYSFLNAYLDPGQAGNWWENDPDPCDYKLRAPIQHYVRTLRVAYEVIHSTDPTAYVLCGGVGYPSFLDAILRNTDNPDGGKITPDFPKKGGAYFDVLGFHAYPHFDASTQKYSDSLQQLVYTRHSDGAAAGIGIVQNRFIPVLEKYGYDGVQKPRKLWTITEANIPRKAFQFALGTAEAQRNYMIKSVVECLKKDFLQYHVYALSEETEYEKATYEFDVMGLYKKIRHLDGPFQRRNDEGIALKTASDILFEKKFDAARTAALNLPATVGGGAFKSSNGAFTYVLWAKTMTDLSEAASATFSFPNSLIINDLARREWDFSRSNLVENVSSNQPFQLTASPIFLTEKKLSLSGYAGCAPFSIQFEDKTSLVGTRKWTFEKGSISSSTASIGSVVFSEAGFFDVSLEIKNAVGQVIFFENEKITVEKKPVAAFSGDLDGALLFLKNTASTNSDALKWTFGDSTPAVFEPNPMHVFLQSGLFKVELLASNECGISTQSVDYQVVAPSENPNLTTADQSVAPLNSPFRLGAVVRYAPNFSDEQTADLLGGNPATATDGVGAKTLKANLPEYFLEGFGYDIRRDAFQHYYNVSLEENTAVVGFPSAGVREKWPFCATDQSIIFKNMYGPIWDGGANGTAVNENNFFASYLYQTVENYKDYVRFWQIYDGVDTDFSGRHGWLPPGQPGNWWENDPEPCETSLRAPIEFFIRKLRIAYEIVHAVDPDGFVTVGGIGYPSFLDVILRKTDNPDGGKIAAGYSKKGGAFFDAFGFNAYPFIDGTTKFYDLAAGGFVYKRHSDAAANGILQQKALYQNVFEKHGYGVSKPSKIWLVSEFGASRDKIQDFFGGEKEQRNYLLKAWATAQKAGFAQARWFDSSDGTDAGQAAFPSDAMGLFKNLQSKSPGDAPKNDLAFAYETASLFLFKTVFDSVRTAQMNLPVEARGMAFRDQKGKFTYIVWAATTTDLVESATASWSVPNSLIINGLRRFEWDFSDSKTSQNVLAAQPILLTETPIFLSENAAPLEFAKAAFSASNASGCAPLSVIFTDKSVAAASRVWTFEGGQPATSTAAAPTIFYAQKGAYKVSLTATNALGSHTSTAFDFVEVLGPPTADFLAEKDAIESALFRFKNSSSQDADSIRWTMPDGSAFGGYNFDWFFVSNGDYEISLIAFSECGSDTIRKTISVQLEPPAIFNFTLPTACENHVVAFQDASLSSPTAWNWAFAGGSPSSSTAQYPVVDFGSTGSFSATLIVSNANGSDTLMKVFELKNAIYNQISPEICSGGTFSLLGEIFDAARPTGEILLAGAAAGGCDSIISVTMKFLPPPTVDVFESIFEGEIFPFNGQNLTAAGVFRDTLKASFGCDSVIVLHLDVLVSTKNEGSKTGLFSARPSPTDGPFFIEIETEKAVDEGRLDIFDATGRLVFSKKRSVAAGKNSFQIDGSSWPSGLFRLRFLDEKGARWATVLRL